MNHNKKTHTQIILITLILILVMAISGIFFGIISGSRSILTDGIVSTVIFSSSSLGLFIQKKLKSDDNYLYPYGKWRFQNIYNLLRMLTLMLIILYSFLEAVFSIYHYTFDHVIPPEINFISAIPYFIIKMLTVTVALKWLHYNKSNLSNEEYKVEFTSISVDGILTLAIILGMAIFANIEPIKEIADSLTLLIVAVILGFSIFKELKGLVHIMIGKRVYIEQEKYLCELINKYYTGFSFRDVHIENYGLITQVFITCSFDSQKNMEDFLNLQENMRELLKNNGLSKPRLQFYFSTNKKDS